MNEKWTDLAKMCYDRGCNCKGCSVNLESIECRMKYQVIELVKKFGDPPDYIHTKIRKNPKEF